MRPKLPARARSVLTVSGALLTSGLLLAVPAPAAPAGASAPLPLPIAGGEPLVSGEGVTIEGPLIQNISLPMLK